MNTQQKTKQNFLKINGNFRNEKISNHWYQKISMFVLNSKLATVEEGISELDVELKKSIPIYPKI